MVRCTSRLWWTRIGRSWVAGMAVAAAAGCNDTRLSIEQTGREGTHTFVLTARECTWANTPDGECCLALSYQWDTHAGQFILEGVRSSYLRLVIRLPEAIGGPGTGGEFPLRSGMVQAYDDYTDRGMCFTGGPGRVSVQLDKNNRAVGSFVVTCRGFLPGRGEKSLFSDDYVLRARFEALPNADATLRMADEVGLFFATPRREFIYKRRPRTQQTTPPVAPDARATDGGPPPRPPE